MTRSSGIFVVSTTLGESVQAFVPHPLPPVDPPLALDAFVVLNRQAGDMVIYDDIWAYHVFVF